MIHRSLQALLVFACSIGIFNLLATLPGAPLPLMTLLNFITCSILFGWILMHKD